MELFHSFISRVNILGRIGNMKYPHPLPLQSPLHQSSQHWRCILYWFRSMCRDMGRTEGAGTLHNSGHRPAAHCYRIRILSTFQLK